MEHRDGFRTAFRGFHRQDVMDYMDSVQADYAEREAGLREGLSEANAYLASLTEENKALKAAANAAEQKAEDLRSEAFDRFEQMNAQLVALKKENDRLRASAARPVVAASPAAPAADAQALIAAIDELRARGADFLAASGNAGAECLDEVDELMTMLETAVGQMRAKVDAARSDLDARRDAAGLRLSELEASLKGETPLPVAPARPAASVAPARPAAPAPTPAAPAASATHTARLVSNPSRPREGLRRFLDGLLG